MSAVAPDMKYVTRQEWGAQPSLSLEKFKQIPYYIALTYVTTTNNKLLKDEKEALRNLQKKHMEEHGFPDIQCNFIIGMEGVVYEGRGWDMRPSLSQESTKRQRNFHGQYLEIMYIGDVGENVNASNPQLKATSDLIRTGIDLMKLPLGFKFLDDVDDPSKKCPIEGVLDKAIDI